MKKVQRQKQRYLNGGLQAESTKLSLNIGSAIGSQQKNPNNYSYDLKHRYQNKSSSFVDQFKPIGQSTSDKNYRLKTSVKFRGKQSVDLNQFNRANRLFSANKNNILSPQPQLQQPLQFEFECGNQFQFEQGMNNLNNTTGYPSSDSRNQILFGDLQHSTKLKNLLRGSTKYQDKLNTLVKQHYDKDSTDSYYRRPSSIGQNTSQNINKKFIGKDKYGSRNLRKSANVQANTSISQGGETLIYTTFDKQSETATKFCEQKDQSQLNTIMNDSSDVQGNQLLNAVKITNISESDTVNLSKYLKQFQMSPSSTQMPSSHIQNNNTNHQLVGKLAINSAGLSNFLNNFHFSNSQNNGQSATINDLIACENNDKFVKIQNEAIQPQIIGSFENYTASAKLQTGMTFDLSQQQWSSNNKWQARKNQNEGIQAFNRINLINNTIGSIEVNQNEDSNGQYPSQQNDSLQHRQNDVDWEMLPWQANVGDSQNSNFNKIHNNSDINYQQQQPQVIQTIKLDQENKEVPEQLKFVDLKLYQKVIPFDGQSTCSNQNQNIFFRRKLFDQAKLSTLSTNGAQNIQKVKTIQIENQHSKVLKRYKCNKQSETSKNEKNSFDTKLQSEVYVDLGAPSNEEESFEQALSNQMRPSGLGAINQPDKSFESKGQSESKMNMRTFDLAQNSQNDNIFSTIPPEEALNNEQIRREGSTSNIKQVDQAKQQNEQRNRDFINIKEQQSSSVDQDQVTEFFKNRRPESITKIMVEAQQSSFNRFQGNFRGTKLVSTSTWNKQKKIKKDLRFLNDKKQQKQFQGANQDDQKLGSGIRNSQTKLLMNAGYCNLAQNRNNKSKSVRSKKLTCRQSIDQNQMSQPQNQNNYKQITAHMPQSLVANNASLDTQSGDNPIGDQVITSPSDQVLYNKSPVTFPIPSTVNTKFINNDSNIPSDRISIEMGNLNFDAENTNLRIFDEFDNNMNSGLPDKDSGSNLPNTNNNITAIPEQHSLLLNQDSIQTKQTQNNQGQVHLFNVKKSQKTQSAYSSKSNINFKYSDIANDEFKVSHMAIPSQYISAVFDDKTQIKKQSLSKQNQNIQRHSLNKNRGSRPAIANAFTNQTGQQFHDINNFNVEMTGLMNEQQNIVVGGINKQNYSQQFRLGSNKLSTQKHSLQMINNNLFEKQHELAVRNSNRVPEASTTKQSYHQTKPLINEPQESNHGSKQSNYQNLLYQNRNKHISIKNTHFDKVAMSSQNQQTKSNKANQKQNLDLSKVQMQEGASIREISQALSEDSNFSPLVIKQAVLKEEQASVDLNNSKVLAHFRINKNKSPEKPIKIQVQDYQINSTKKKQQNELIKEQQIIGAYSPKIDNRNRPKSKRQQKLERTEQNVLETSLDDQKLYSQNHKYCIKNQNNDIKDCKCECCQQIESSQNKADATQIVRQSGFRSMNSIPETIRHQPRNQNIEVTGARTSRIKQTGVDDISELFQLNLSKEQKSSNQNQILNSWRVSGSRSNQGSVILTGQIGDRIEPANSIKNEENVLTSSKIQQDDNKIVENIQKQTENEIHNVNNRYKKRYSSKRNKKSQRIKRVVLSQEDSKNGRKSKIIIEGGESFYKQTQHHLSINIGSKEAVHSMITQMLPAVLQGCKSNFEINSTNQHAYQNKNQTAVIELISKLHRSNLREQTFMNQGSIGSPTSPLTISGQKVKMSQKQISNKTNASNNHQTNEQINEMNNEQLSITVMPDEKAQTKMSSRGNSQVVYAMMHGEALAIGYNAKLLKSRKSSDKIVDIKGKQAVSFCNQNKDIVDSPSQTTNRLLNGATTLIIGSQGELNNQYLYRQVHSAVARHRKLDTHSRLFWNPYNLTPICSDDQDLKQLKRNQNILQIADLTRNQDIMQIAVQRKKVYEQIQTRIGQKQTNLESQQIFNKNNHKLNLNGICFGLGNDPSSTRIEIHIPDAVENNIKNLVTKRPSRSQVDYKNHIEKHQLIGQDQNGMLETLNMPVSMDTVSAQPSMNQLTYMGINENQNKSNHEEASNIAGHAMNVIEVVKRTIRESATDTDQDNQEVSIKSNSSYYCEFTLNNQTFI